MSMSEKSEAALKAETPAGGGETSGSEGRSAAGRGERQKPVSKAYRDNWNAIFQKKKR